VLSIAAVEHAKKPLTTIPQGANLHDCLSSDDIDALLKPLLASHYVEASLLYELRQRNAAAISRADALHKRLETCGWLFLPAHIRHHWCTAIIVKEAHGVTVHIYDSAPSIIVRNELTALFASMGFVNTTYACHARQPRCSNDCGLHVIWLACLQDARARSPRLLDAMQKEQAKRARTLVLCSPPPSVPLGGLRAFLVRNRRQGLNAERAREVTRIAAEITAPEGGGLDIVERLKEYTGNERPVDLLRADGSWLHLKDVTAVSEKTVSATNAISNETGRWKIADFTIRDGNTRDEERRNGARPYVDSQCPSEEKLAHEATPQSEVSTETVSHFVHTVQSLLPDNVTLMDSHVFASLIATRHVKTARQWEKALRANTWACEAQAAGAIVHHHGHYFGVVANREERSITVFDSFPTHRAHERDELVKAFLAAVVIWWNVTCTGSLSPQGKRQQNGDNNCFFHAASNVVSKLTRRKIAVTRADLTHMHEPAVFCCRLKGEYTQLETQKASVAITTKEPDQSTQAVPVMRAKAVPNATKKGKSGPTSMAKQKDNSTKEQEIAANPVKEKATDAEVPPYVRLKPDAPQIDQLFDPKSLREANRDAIVLRMRGDRTGPVSCPLCMEVYAAADSRPGLRANALRRHMAQKHNATVRGIHVVPCPCPANKCGGSELLAAAMQQPKSNGKAGITPHVGRNRCTRCNTWLGRWSGQAHPCIPDEPGQHPPWPVPEAKATKPGVADDLSRSPSQDDGHRCETVLRESTSEDAAPPDFRPPAGGEVLKPKRHHLIALKVASSEYANSFVWRGLAYETRQDHANLLRRVAAAAEAQKPSGPTDEPADTWLMRLVRSWGRRRRWRWATMTSTMSSLQSAFKYLPAYMKTAQRWQLHADGDAQGEAGQHTADRCRRA
jgi:hypothetical protein